MAVVVQPVNETRLESLGSQLSGFAWMQPVSDLLVQQSPLMGEKLNEIQAAEDSDDDQEDTGVCIRQNADCESKISKSTA